MPLTISDDLLVDAGMCATDARVEIACRLFEAGKLNLPQTSRWTGLSRVEVEHQLLQRGIPLYRPTVKDLDSDLAAFEGLETADASSNQ